MNKKKEVVMNEETEAMGQEPEKLFTLPEEYMKKLEKLSAELETREAEAQQRQPYMDHIRVKRDMKPVMRFGKPEIITTSSGPMIVRKRNTKVKMYHEDGTSSFVPLDGQMRYIDKGFSTSPIVDPPENKRICPYCFKKFRETTSREMAMNNARPVINDPEVKRLLEEMKKEYGELEMGVRDVDYKLAEHIRVKHGRLAAFVNDPIYKKMREADTAIGE